MKKKDVPQDVGMMGPYFEICYAVDDDGRYVQAPSKGWEPKNTAMKQAWDVIHERLSEVRNQVTKGLRSPLAYHMEKNLMDIGLLASYVGMSRWRVKRHLKPDVYADLKPAVLQRYADLFGITVEELSSCQE